MNINQIYERNGEACFQQLPSRNVTFRGLGAEGADVIVAANVEGPSTAYSMIDGDKREMRVSVAAATVVLETMLERLPEEGDTVAVDGADYVLDEVETSVMGVRMRGTRALMRSVGERRQ